MDAYPIPEKKNIVLVLAVFVFAVTLLKVVTVAQSAWVTAIAMLFFAYIMLTNYSLAHEAAHLKLLKSKTANHLLGLIPAFLFPMSLTLLINTHTTHHTQNRSIGERFDFYQAGDRKALKYLVWYSILVGFFGLYPPLGSVVIAVIPIGRLKKFFQQMLSMDSYVSRFSVAEARRIRWECIGMLLFHTAILYFFNINPSVWLLCYGAAWVNWSTRQFIEHAFSPIDLVEGCYNLKHNRMMSLVLLHRELDLSHHRQPDVPWIYLPHLPGATDRQFDYGKQYLRMWKGPRPLEREATV